MSQFSFFYYLMMAFGVFILLVALTNWEWFFSLKKAKWLSEKTGRTGARVIYGILALIFIVFGWLVLNGIIQVEALGLKK
ncbi:hypothetical protein DMA11_08675 [Marinilabiliaceae bacterium JC017]|nr:hypothetical protein DMA11_08675 [Marinilabiliaceae bacterium JC017]